MRRARPLALLLLVVVALLAAGCEGRRQVRISLDDEGALAPPAAGLAGVYWQPGRYLSAGVLLVPAAADRREDWLAFGDRLHQNGYSVLAIEPRGAGERPVREAVAAAFAFLRTQQRVDAARLALVTAGDAVPGALGFSATEPSIRALVLLSPPEEPRELLAERLAYFGWRPVLLAAGQRDANGQRLHRLATHARGPSAVRLYENDSQGAGLLQAAPGLQRAILEFFDLHLRSPVLDTSVGGG